MIANLIPSRDTSHILWCIESNMVYYVCYVMLRNALHVYYHVRVGNNMHTITYVTNIDTIIT